MKIVSSSSQPASLFDRLWRRLELVSDGRFALLLVALVLLRAGSYVQLDLDWLNQCVAAFPRPGDNFRCHNVAPWLLPALLKVDTREEWGVLHGALTVCVLLGTLALARLRYRGLSFRLVALWMSVSAAPVVLLQTRVFYDVYIILAGSLIGLATSWPVALAGGLVLGLSHPQQALVAGAAFGAVAVALGRQRVARTKAALLGCVLGAGLTALQGLISPPAGPGRAGVLGRSVGKALFHAAQTGTMGVYACYGLAWLLLGAWALEAPLTPRGRIGLALGLLVLPAAVTLVTLDGTRVFVGASWPAFLLFVTTVCEREVAGPARTPVRVATCLALLMACIAPAYATMGAGVSRPRLGTFVHQLSR